VGGSRNAARRTAATLAAVLAGLALCAPTAPARVLKDPVAAKSLGSGAIYQARLSARSCVARAQPARLGRQRCTTIAQLKGVDTTVRPVVAADSKAIYLAANDGVLVLRRDRTGRLAYDSCQPVTGPCGALEDGNTVSELVLGPGGQQLYAVVQRQRDNGAEIHGLPIGADDRLGPAPGCLLRARVAQYEELANPRGCQVDEGYDHAQTSGLVLTPDGRFAYLITDGPDTVGVAELTRSADGTLVPAAGCVSIDGSRGFEHPGECQTLLPSVPPSDPLVDLKQLAVTPDGASLIALSQRAFDKPGAFSTEGGIVVRFAIDDAGGLVRGAAPTACIDHTGLNGCSASRAMVGTESRIAVADKRVYVASTVTLNNAKGTNEAAVLGYQLGADGGLELPSAAAGCVGATTVAGARIKKLGSCSLGRETLRNLLDLVAGPRGHALYAVGGMGYGVMAVSLLRLGPDGTPKAPQGPTGCLGSFPVRERTPCNHPLAPEALADADTTLALAPNGQAGYVLSNIADNVARLSVLQIRP
jgi:hypothetical protein